MGVVIPCSRPHDNIVVLNIAIVSVLNCRAIAAVTSALRGCLASISDGLVEAFRSISGKSSLKLNRYSRNRRRGESKYAADNTTRPCQQHIDQAEMKTKEWTAKVVAWLKRSILQYLPSYTYRSDLETIMPVGQDPPLSLIPQESAKA